MSQTTVLPFVTRPAPEHDFGQAPPKQNGGEPPLAGIMRVLGGGEEGRERQHPTRRPARGILVPGQMMPHVILNTVQGGKLEIGAPTGTWQMIVVYRGKHCPVSKNYLASLQQIVFELVDLGVEVVAVSGDGRERADAFLEALKATTESKEVTFKIAYGLPLEEMLRWGLFVSQPRSIRETDQPFPEPGLFVLNPDGQLVIIDYSNSPFSRPDLRILIEGIRYIQENDYPVRGTYGFY